MQPSRRTAMGIMGRHHLLCLRTMRLPGEHMTFMSRRAVGKDNASGTGSKLKMIYAANERIKAQRRSKGGFAKQTENDLHNERKEYCMTPRLI
jgi:hypothetical protein